jgi:glycosyltransferase involved in cell wall biosynthesis
MPVRSFAVTSPRSAAYRTDVAERTRLGEVLFVHDYPFLHAADGAVYSDRGDWPWQHYLAFADRVTVASRGEALANRDRTGLTAVSRPEVAYEAISSLSGPWIRYSNRPRARRRMRALVERADAVVARLPSELGTLAVELAERTGTPYAVELVTCTWDALWNYGTWQGKAYAPISWWKTRRLVRRAPFVLYVTQEFLQRRYPTGGRSVGCSDVELSELDRSVLERRLARISAAERPVRIGTIAALTVRFKGIQTALEALGRIRDAVPPFELHVLGAGDSTPWRRLAAEHGVDGQTHFDGTLPPGEPVRDWLDSVDLYIQPSFQEGLPRGLVEALSRACPALGSTAGGIPELLDPECLHRPGDVERLAELISRAATDRRWQAAQARRNFEAAARYTREELDRVRAGFWHEFARSVRG